MVYPGVKGTGRSSAKVCVSLPGAIKWVNSCGANKTVSRFVHLGRYYGHETKQVKTNPIQFLSFNRAGETAIITSLTDMKSLLWSRTRLSERYECFDGWKKKQNMHEKKKARHFHSKTGCEMAWFRQTLLYSIMSALYSRILHVFNGGQQLCYKVTEESTCKTHSHQQFGSGPLSCFGKPLIFKEYSVDRYNSIIPVYTRERNKLLPSKLK